MGYIYDKLRNWLFPIHNYEIDVFPPPSSYDCFQSTLFQDLIKNYLACNETDRAQGVKPTSLEIEKNQSLLRQCGFSNGEYIERLIMSEFRKMKRDIPDLNPLMFADFFEGYFHNVKLVDFATLEIQELNKVIKEYYCNVKCFLIEIQSVLKDVNLRIQIEYDYPYAESWYYRSKVEEFVTPFAMVGLICNKSAKFCINYFINPHLKELIGESLGDILEKRFDELVNSEMKDFVKMISLEGSYDGYFEQLQRFSQADSNYKSRNNHRPFMWF